MKRLAIIAAAACSALALGVGWAASSTDAGPSFSRTIYVVNNSKLVSDDEVANDLVAFQTALKDFESYWGGSIQLKQVSKVPYRAWGITVSDHADCSQCLGYHGVRGVPYAKVFVTGGWNWTITFTHELFEMAADPWLRRSNIVGTTFWLVEVGDPVEDDLYAYTRPGGDGDPVQISDFVTDQWYRPNARGKLDFAGHVHRSLQLLPGGYASYWGYADGRTGWQQVFGPVRKGSRPG